jgi:hypothetical protein
MQPGDCYRCQKPMRWYAQFEQDETQALEVMEGYGEDSRMVVKDVTYPVVYDVARCPHCKRMLQFDALGGLGEITEDDLKSRPRLTYRPGYKDEHHAP